MLRMMNCKDKTGEKSPKTWRHCWYLFYSCRICFAEKEYDKICIFTGNRQNA